MIHAGAQKKIHALACVGPALEEFVLKHEECTETKVNNQATRFEKIYGFPPPLRRQQIAPPPSQSERSTLGRSLSDDGGVAGAAGEAGGPAAMTPTDATSAGSDPASSVNGVAVAAMGPFSRDGGPGARQRAAAGGYRGRRCLKAGEISYAFGGKGENTKIKFSQKLSSVESANDGGSGCFLELYTNQVDATETGGGVTGRGRGVRVSLLCGLCEDPPLVAFGLCCHLRVAGDLRRTRILSTKERGGTGEAKTAVAAMAVGAAPGATGPGAGMGFWRVGMSRRHLRLTMTPKW